MHEYKLHKLIESKRGKKTIQAGVEYKKKKKYGHPEYDIHKAIADYLEKVIDSQQVFWSSVEVSNHDGSYVGEIRQGMDRKKGVRGGLQDIPVFFKRIDVPSNIADIVPGLRPHIFNSGGVDGQCFIAVPITIEIKNKGNYLQTEQKYVKGQMEAIGVPTEVARSVDDIRDILKKYEIKNREVTF